MWIFCHTAYSDIHFACKKQKGMSLSTCSRDIYVQMTGPDTEAGKFHTSSHCCHTSLCSTSPSLVAVTFHTKVCVSSAQRQLVNWQPGQASTFSSGVSLRVVCTWVWWGVQTHISIELVPSPAQMSKYHGSQNIRQCFVAQMPISTSPEKLRACLWAQAFAPTEAMGLGEYSLGYSPWGSWRQWLLGWKSLLGSQSRAVTDLQRKAGRP